MKDKRAVLVLDYRRNLGGNQQTGRDREKKKKCWPDSKKKQQQRQQQLSSRTLIITD